MKKIFLLFTAVTLLSSCEAIFVEDISDNVVDLLAPSEGTTLDSGAIIFTWNSIGAAEAYQIQIATPTFIDASQIVLDTVITKTSFTKELLVENYQWRVKAINSEYQTEYTTNSFSVQ